MKHEDHCEAVHRKLYGKSDKANAFENQNADFREGYDWGIQTFAYDAEKVLKAELDFRAEFKMTGRGFNEWKRGFWSARSQMKCAGIKKKAVWGSPLE